MSLLKAFRIPQLRAVTRPALVARMASLPGGEFDFEAEPATPEWEEQPPVGPDTAYPVSAPNPMTPIRAAVPARTRQPPYTLYVHSNMNNNILTFTRPDGSPIMNVSGGQVGYKHKARGTAEAAHLCALRAFKRILDESEQQGPGNMSLDVLFNGFGRGRDAVFRALLAAESAPVRQLVGRVGDITKIKIGGTRSKKARRV
ncbi:mitochondrial 37S ribosomal protein [Phanerochaete sordida]|uniref:Mitochondrial 37S ribosomal protein n=1 Tax=Phanerochaete sordida TaxID=48140 RepID=A0A9P3FXE7_9APHY|nr:mitochondrial 37S ribosomal protein [Phanerochaete sordida]